MPSSTVLSPGDVSGGVFGAQNTKIWGPSRKNPENWAPFSVKWAIYYVHACNNVGTLYLIPAHYPRMYVSRSDPCALCSVASSGAIFLHFDLSGTARGARLNTGWGFQIVMSRTRSFVGEVFPFTSALEVGNKNEIKTRLKDLKQPCSV
jgi:hypothetical protein